MSKDAKEKLDTHFDAFKEKISETWDGIKDIFESNEEDAKESAKE